MKKEDFKPGLFIQHTFAKNDIRIGKVESIGEVNGDGDWVVSCNLDSEGSGCTSGFFFYAEDLKDIIILSKEESPEYYL